MSFPHEMPIPSLPPYEGTVGAPSTDAYSTAEEKDSSAQDHAAPMPMPMPTAEHSVIPMPSSAYTSEKQELDQRALPIGWIQQFDPQTNRVYYVDTHTYPARSIWTHPLDDEGYLERIGGYNANGDSRSTSFNFSITHTHSMSSSLDGSKSEKSKRGFGSYLKGKITGTSHEEREEAKREKEKREEEKRQRKKLEEEEAKKEKMRLKEAEEEKKRVDKEKEEEERVQREDRAAENEKKKKEALAKATETGEPQYLWKNKAGQDVYARPSPKDAPYIRANIGNTPYMTPDEYKTGPGYDPNYQEPSRNQNCNHSGGGGGGRRNND